MNKTVIIGAVVGAVGVAGAGGGATYYLKHAGPNEAELKVAAEMAERERFAREEEIHHATVFSAMRQEARGGSSSVPVIVTINLAGTQGFAAFCAQVPAVEEAVLRTLSAEGLDGRMREAINRALPEKPVRGASARLVTDPNAGGLAARDTEAKCRKALKA